MLSQIITPSRTLIDSIFSNNIEEGLNLGNKFYSFRSLCNIHFPKIHRSVLRTITIDVLHFCDVYSVNL